MGLYREFYSGENKKKNRLISNPSISTQALVGFFDGIAQMGKCGGWMFLRINEDHNFRLWMSCGSGTNTKA